MLKLVYTYHIRCPKSMQFIFDIFTVLPQFYQIMVLLEMAYDTNVLLSLLTNGMLFSETPIYFTKNNSKQKIKQNVIIWCQKQI